MAQIDLNDEQKEFLVKLSFYYIETRYPEELSKISKSITRKIAGEYLGKTKEFIKWLKKEF